MKKSKPKAGKTTYETRKALTPKEIEAALARVAPVTAMRPIRTSKIKSKKGESRRHKLSPWAAVSFFEAVFLLLLLQRMLEP